ncbi:PKD domain-containing protein [Oligoflexia bacterium]|nr:PKD domain-containing protein [Oligoflexia bacterium]
MLWSRVQVTVFFLLCMLSSSEALHAKDKKLIVIKSSQILISVGSLSCLLPDRRLVLMEGENSARQLSIRKLRKWGRQIKAKIKERKENGRKPGQKLTIRLKNVRQYTREFKQYRALCAALAPHCYNEIQDGDEEGRDCGGSCLSECGAATPNPGTTETATPQPTVTPESSPTVTPTATPTPTSIFTPSSDDEIDASFEVSRSACVAPCAVFFDATGTTAIGVDRPFHHLDYSWNFDDSAAGTWAVSGKSKNTAKGALAAHVFEAQGEYNVRLSVKDSLGNVNNIETAQIIVSDPDTVFSGTNTVCFSNDQDFTGCPPTAQQIATSNFISAMSNIGTGKRLLFKRGDTFTATSNGNIGVAGPGLIGAFGVCNSPNEKGICQNAPSIIAAHGGSGIRVTSTGTAPDWRITDLELVGPGTASSRGIGAYGGQDHILISRMKLRNYHGGIYNQKDSENFFIYDSIVQDNQGGGGGNLAYLGGYHLALLGSSLTNSTNVEHVLRIYHTDNSVVSNNNLAFQSPNKHVFKLHNGTWNSEPGDYAEKIIIADNVIENSDIPGSDWTIGIGTSSSSRDEELRDIIVERNHIIGGTDGQQVLLNVWSKDVTIRNNLFDINSGASNLAISVTSRGPIEAPDRVEIYSNTAYGSSSSSSPGVRFLSIGSDARNIVARNNLVASEDVNNATIFSGTLTHLTESNNLAAATSVFINSTPFNADEFKLHIGSSAIDTGSTIGSIYEDFECHVRPQGSGYDIGAHEYVPGP